MWVGKCAKGCVYAVLHVFNDIEKLYDETMRRHKHLRDAYRFPGFTPSTTVKRVFGDPKARVIELGRRQKKHAAHFAIVFPKAFTITRYDGYETFRRATPVSIWM